MATTPALFNLVADDAPDSASRRLRRRRRETDGMSSGNSTALQVMNLPPHMSVKAIRAHFSMYGGISDIKYTYSKRMGGCAVVNFADAAGRQRAAHALAPHARTGNENRPKPHTMNATVQATQDHSASPSRPRMACEEVPLD